MLGTSQWAPLSRKKTGLAHARRAGKAVGGNLNGSVCEHLNLSLFNVLTCAAPSSGAPSPAAVPGLGACQVWSCWVADGAVAQLCLYFGFGN